MDFTHYLIMTKEGGVISKEYNMEPDFGDDDENEEESVKKLLKEG